MMITCITAYVFVVENVGFERLAGCLTNRMHASPPPPLLTKPTHPNHHDRRLHLVDGMLQQHRWHPRRLYQVRFPPSLVSY